MARLKYPLTVVGGRLAFSSQDRAEKNLSVLSTIRGERVYRPNYGSPINLFDDINNIPSYAEIVGFSSVSVNADEVDIAD